MNKEYLINHLEYFSESLQTLADELQQEEVQPYMLVSMQIFGERDYNKLEKLMANYLKELENR